MKAMNNFQPNIYQDRNSQCELSRVLCAFVIQRCILIFHKGRRSDKICPKKTSTKPNECCWKSAWNCNNSGYRERKTSVQRGSAVRASEETVVRNISQYYGANHREGPETITSAKNSRVRTINASNSLCFNCGVSSMSIRNQAS